MFAIFLHNDRMRIWVRVLSGPHDRGESALAQARRAALGRSGGRVGGYGRWRWVPQFSDAFRYRRANTETLLRSLLRVHSASQRVTHNFHLPVRPTPSSQCCICKALALLRRHHTIRRTVIISIFTALQCRRGIAMRILSVCPSVYHTRVL